MTPQPKDYFNVLDKTGRKIKRKRITYVGEDFFNVYINNKRESFPLNRLYRNPDGSDLVKWFLLSVGCEEWD